MNTKLSFFSTALLASALLLPGSIPAARAQNQYPSNLRNQYMASCKQRAVSEGLSAAQAQQLCQCTLSRLQARFTSAQYLAQARRAAQTGRTPQAFSEIGMACYRQLN